MVVVRPRMDEVADIDRDSGADGPLSCLRRKVDPGRNKGRAAATGPVIANGIVEAAAEAGVEGEGGRRVATGQVVFGRGTFSMPPRVTCLTDRGA